ncbi:hypothetical protein DFS34DRAFT_162347 [Phlyctochytrium arcticum]|nr:hypothetical protein DFS34DRAFT_162347 [Phlyctochytrium arcticum]
MSTTELQNYSGRLVQVVTAQPIDSLADTVGSVSGTPLLLSELAQRVTLLEGSLVTLQATIDAHAMLFGRTFLRNAASEILLFALGRQPRPPHSTNYFTVLASEGSTQLSSVVTSLNQTLVAPTTEAGLAGILDDVSERRNGTIHYSNRQDLETSALLPARDLLSRHTQLRVACPREVLVVDNYEIFRSAFGF